MIGKRSANISSTRGGDTALVAEIFAVAMLAGAGGLVFLAVQATYDTLALSNDGAQYLSAVRNFLAGNGVSTSTLYYDVQLASPTPAPLLTWPPGFPLVAAAVTALGAASDIDALRLVPLMAHLFTGFVLYALVRLVGHGYTLSLVVAAAWMLSVMSWIGTVQGFSDSLFGLFIALTALGLAAHKNDGKAHAWPWLLGAALALCMAILIRYQGVAYTVPLFFALVCLYSNDAQSSASRWLNPLWLSALPVLVLLALLARNFMLSGVLTGGAVTDRGTPLNQVAASVASIPPHYRTVAIALMALVCLVALLEAARLCFAAAFRDERGGPDHARRARLRAIACFGLAGFALNFFLMLTLSLRSSAYALDTRNFLTALPPLAIALLARMSLSGLSARFHSRSVQTVMAAAVIAIAVIQAAVLYRSHFLGWLEQSRTTAIANLLDSTRLPDGRPLVTLLRASEGGAKCIVSNESQQLSIFSNLPTIGVPRRNMTNRDWNADDIIAKSRFHKCDYAIMFRDVVRDPTDQTRRMFSEGNMPGWFMPEVATPQLLAGRILARR